MDGVAYCPISSVSTHGKGAEHSQPRACDEDSDFQNSFAQGLW